MSLRNVALVAHVDHGKTTLVDGLLRSTGDVLRLGMAVAGGKRQISSQGSVICDEPLMAPVKSKRPRGPFAARRPVAIRRRSKPERMLCDPRL